MTATPGQPAEPSRPKRRLPRLSIFQLLYLITVVAFSLTMFARGAEHQGFFASNLSLRYALGSLATLGLIPLLWGQAGSLAALRGFGTTRALRYACAFGLGACLTLRMAIQAGLLERDAADDVWSFYDHDNLSDLCLDAVWQLLMCVGLGTLVGGTREQRTLNASSMSWLAPGLALTMVFLFLVAMAADFTLIAFLVHIATSGIEASHAPQFFRHGTFPSHAQENFFTFRMAQAGLAVLVVSTAAGLSGIVSRSPGRRRVLVGAASLGVGVLLAFVGWFHRFEAPRVSPDLSVNSPAAVPIDLLSGGLLLVALSVWMAVALERWRTDADAVTLSPAPGPLGRLPAGVAIGGAGLMSWIAFGEAVYAIFDYTFFDAFGSGSLLDLVRYCSLSPTTLLVLALGVQSVRAAIGVWRRDAVIAFPVNRGRVASGTLLLIALVVVGVPTLTIFGFCSWLGPWWQ